VLAHPTLEELAVAIDTLGQAWRFATSIYQEPSLHRIQKIPLSGSAEPKPLGPSVKRQAAEILVKVHARMQLDKKGRKSALRASPQDVREQHEKQLKVLLEALPELRVRKYCEFIRSYLQPAACLSEQGQLSLRAISRPQDGRTRYYDEGSLKPSLAPRSAK